MCLRSFTYIPFGHKVTSQYIICINIYVCVYIYVYIYSKEQLSCVTTKTQRSQKKKKIHASLLECVIFLSFPQCAKFVCVCVCVCVRVCLLFHQEL